MKTKERGDGEERNPKRKRERKDNRGEKKKNRGES
jgi:hypothetical protein